MPSVFINYRRGDTAGDARALFNMLAATLGADSVFMDVDAIAVGRDFRKVIRDRLAACDQMIAFIGQDWLAAADQSGRRLGRSRRLRPLRDRNGHQAAFASRRCWSRARRCRQPRSCPKDFATSLT